MDATPSTTLRLLTRTSAGSCERMPCFVSAAVGPAISFSTAASTPLPRRLATTDCSPRKKETSTLTTLDLASAFGRRRVDASRSAFAPARLDLAEADRPVVAERPVRVVRDLPRMAVRVDEHPRVAAPERRAALTRD